MRRIEVAPKWCECGDAIERRRYPCGKLEPPGEYNRKRTCYKPRCIGRLLQRGRKAKPRHCANPDCGKVLERKRFPSGIESYAVFLRRRFCDNACRWAWNDATSWSRELARAIPSCVRCGVEPQRHTLRSPLCKSCAFLIAKPARRAEQQMRVAAVIVANILRHVAPLSYVSG